MAAAKFATAQKEGTALRGKILLSAITAGGREVACQPDGYNRFTVRQLRAPIEQTAILAQHDETEGNRDAGWYTETLREEFGTPAA